MKVKVDSDSCIGCGLCAGTVPEVFQVNDAGTAEVIAEASDDKKDAVQEAIDGCPVSAISEE